MYIGIIVNHADKISCVGEFRILLCIFLYKQTFIYWHLNPIKIFVYWTFRQQVKILKVFLKKQCS